MYRARAFVAGMVGATAITIVTAAVRAAGTNVDFELLAGTLFGGKVLTDAGTSVAWIVGLVIHLFFGGLLGLIYAAGFERLLGRASVGFGMLFGAAHALVAGVLLGLLPSADPVVPGVVAAPGLFMTRLGMVGFLTFCLVHLLFGMIVGGLYAPVTQAHRHGPGATEAEA